jgi:hypothetical protein
MESHLGLFSSRMVKSGEKMDARSGEIINNTMQVEYVGKKTQSGEHSGNIRPLDGG